jgi:hypothetical protein
MSDQEMIDWIIKTGAHAWPTRSGYGTKGRGPIQGWTVQVITDGHKVIQPTRSDLREAIQAAADKLQPQ